MAMSEALASSVLACRWDCCEASFETVKDLKSHVAAHLRSLMPIRRKDLPLLRRAEDGVGDSMSIDPKLFSTYSQLSQEQKPESQASDGPTSSLPSPPRSDASVSPLVENAAIPQTTVARQQFQSEVNTEPSGLQLIDGSQDSHMYATPHSARVYRATPPFGALSSPSKSPHIESLPLSPDLGAMISNTHQHTRKRKRADDIPRLRLPQSASIDSHISQSSMRSIDAVEEQLTQSFEHGDDEYRMEQYIHTDQLAADAGFDYPSIGSNPYAGEIFGSLSSNSHTARSYPEVLTKPSPPSQPSQQVDSQETTESQAESSSSNLELPPPGQRPRESPFMDQTQSQAVEVSYSNFFPPSMASDKPSWSDASQQKPSTNGASTSVLNTVSPASLHTTTPRRRGFMSGKLPPFSELGRRDSSIQRAADGGLIHRHYRYSQQPSSPVKRARFEEEAVQSGSSQEDTSGGSQEESQEHYYPPLQTQAPYQSQFD